VHYHYFTLEQREALSLQIQELTAQDRSRSASALERLRSPDYGICEICESDIPFARLLKDPFQRTCGRCR
jgi:RNA polymerase-binding transcription factor DksA